jgi:ABC-2 type transport system ATP-binding protein/lipopolysaccharide transport system ATP-binding protein
LAHIALTDASLDIPLYGVGTQHLRSAVLGALFGLGKSSTIDHSIRSVRTLDRLTLRVDDGDRVALIGANGAGKTTLLRLMSGIYEPTSGSISRHGRIQTVLDVNSGLEEEATGRDNIIIRARYMGASARQARGMVDDVVHFAQLDKFIDLPIRTYSAGMRLRLAFAIATGFEADILLIDEILGVGDAAFQKKAETRMLSMLDRAGLVVLATHSLALSVALARRAIYLVRGAIMVDGPYDTVVSIYTNHVARLQQNSIAAE